MQFLTTFTVSLMKSLDIRSEPAVRLLAEFLDMDSGGTRVNAEHFAHELYSYLRSPYRDLTVYDGVVQARAGIIKLSHTPIPSSRTVVNGATPVPVTVLMSDIIEVRRVNGVQIETDQGPRIPASERGNRSSHDPSQAATRVPPVSEVELPLLRHQDASVSVMPAAASTPGNPAGTFTPNCGTHAAGIGGSQGPNTVENPNSKLDRVDSQRRNEAIRTRHRTLLESVQAHLSRDVSAHQRNQYGRNHTVPGVTPFPAACFQSDDKASRDNGLVPETAATSETPTLLERLSERDDTHSPRTATPRVFASRRPVNHLQNTPQGDRLEDQSPQKNSSEASELRQDTTGDIDEGKAPGSAEDPAKNRTYASLASTVLRSKLLSKLANEKCMVEPPVKSDNPHLVDGCLLSTCAGSVATALAGGADVQETTPLKVSGVETAEMEARLRSQALLRVRLREEREVAEAEAGGGMESNDDIVDASSTDVSAVASQEEWLREQLLRRRLMRRT
ncbi:hypothetical protein IEO21_06844 [Rhodonia placenta]|uniref:Uncharacterized protein n=1 Tax=Rhodonia placenta TaxID=104341 RepID=A0A8H7NZ76_9APHY|nr:hypothetical protein IEO21_06844 [Postia placenta]